MMFREFLQQSHIYVGVEREVLRLHTLLLKAKTRIVIRSYLRDQQTRKLQIGAGPTNNPGWLTTDIQAKLRRTTVYLDATRPFPMPDACLDYIFSEHMIEHIDYPSAQFMLQECFRALKPAGKIRLATPDLDALLRLRESNLTESQQQYVGWTVANFLPDGTPAEPIFVINNQFRNYGHQFLFDEPCLTRLLARAGFRNIRRVPVGVSDDGHLRGVERHGQNISSEEMNAFETMVLEADR